MLQRTCLGILAAVLLGAFAMPVHALTAQEKMTTCKFGADSQKLAGTARKTFITKCMANESAPAPRPKPQ